MAIVKRRMTGHIEGDFVVFLIGMRINQPWRVGKWLPVFSAMPKMIAELRANPASGFLGAEQALLSPRMPLLLQYWRSFEHLERYARDRDAEHYPAWVAFNKSIGSDGSVGIWHETYMVPAGSYETVYNNMPLFGLAKSARAVPASGYRATAAGRAGQPVNEELAVPVRDER
jgi:hypothetical protein